MPEARDRLSRLDDVVAASYSRRRVSRSAGRNIGRGSGSIIFVLGNEIEGGRAPGTPYMWRGAAMVGTPGRMGLAAVGTPRVGRNAPPIVGRENLSPAVGCGRGRGRGSDLPNWYPRRPLNDTTAVVRAIQRSRDPLVSTSAAQLEHDIYLISPFPTMPNTRCPPTIGGKVPKILLDNTHQNDGDSGFLTPPKKLLKNIDTVEKVVMEELRKLKRTPSAKREERNKRLRTLMSMR